MKKMMLVFAIVLSVFGCSKPADVTPVVPVVKDTVKVVIPVVPVVIPLVTPTSLQGKWTNKEQEQQVLTFYSMYNNVTYTTNPTYQFYNKDSVLSINYYDKIFWNSTWYRKRPLNYPTSRFLEISLDIRPYYVKRTTTLYQTSGSKNVSYDSIWLSNDKKLCYVLENNKVATKDINYWNKFITTSYFSKYSFNSGSFVELINSKGLSRNIDFVEITWDITKQMWISTKKVIRITEYDLKIYDRVF